MIIQAKPCAGSFSEETIRILLANIGRAQWLPHPCAVCGQQVGAKLQMGHWVPEQHWPSVSLRKPTRPAVRDPEPPKDDGEDKT